VPSNWTGPHSSSTTASRRTNAWLEDEEEFPNPMRRLKPLAVPEVPVPVLDDEALRRLFESCEGDPIQPPQPS
jgi:hypothetical protein